MKMNQLTRNHLKKKRKKKFNHKLDQSIEETTETPQISEKESPEIIEPIEINSPFII